MSQLYTNIPLDIAIAIERQGYTYEGDAVVLYENPSGARIKRGTIIPIFVSRSDTRNYRSATQPDTNGLWYQWVVGKVEVDRAGRAELPTKGKAPELPVEAWREHWGRKRLSPDEMMEITRLVSLASKSKGGKT